MSIPTLPLTPAQEQEAQALAGKLQAAAKEDLLQLARLLVSKRTEELFGQTEFEVRDRVLRIGAHAYELHLREKKRLPRQRGRVSRLPTDGRAPRLSRQNASELARTDSVPARLLLLSSLRSRLVSLGSGGRVNVQAFDAWG